MHMASAEIEKIEGSYPHHLLENTRLALTPVVRILKRFNYPLETKLSNARGSASLTQNNLAKRSEHVTFLYMIINETVPDVLLLARREMRYEVTLVENRDKSVTSRRKGAVANVASTGSPISGNHGWLREVVVPLSRASQARKRPSNKSHISEISSATVPCKFGTTSSRIHVARLRV